MTGVEVQRLHLRAREQIGHPERFTQAVTVVPNYFGIGPAKALAESLIRYLAVELAPRGTRANTVSAGALPTDALRAVVPNLDERLPAMAAANPSGRNVDFDDVTALIECLASPAGAMIQGRTIMVDGGLTLR